jgi:hypothetical protein
MVAAGLVAAITVVTVFASNSVYRDDDMTYTEIVSPDGRYTVAVAEGMNSDGALAEAYIRRGPVFAQLVAQWDYDDECTPVSDGSFTAQWEEDSLTISFAEGIAHEDVRIPFE